MKRLLLFVTFLALLLSLSGCFFEPAENLYAVPKQSQDFYDLQKAIERIMPAGGSYSPPVSGENQQVVQLADLDGDKEDEAIVFLKAEGDMPLSVCVFDKMAESYALIAKIDGVGSAFDHVEYVEINGKPGKEIVVGRQISDQVTQLLNAYTLTEQGMAELLNASYLEFITTDLNSDRKTDILLLTSDGDAQNGIAELYHWKQGQMQKDIEARMSAPASAVKRIITGKMCTGAPAVFVASEYSEGTIITDVFGCVDGTLTNFTLSEDTDTSVQTVREYYVYSCDIDSDGLIELPSLIGLPSIAGESSSENQSLISWYNMLLDGTIEEKCLTYHNYSGGWYLTMREAWAKTLTVSRFLAFGNVSGYRFALLENGTVQELFSLVAVTGEDGAKAEAAGWEKLTEKGETAYYFSMGEGASANDLNEKAVKRMFRFIYMDWNTGETEN